VPRDECRTALLGRGEKLGQPFARFFCTLAQHNIDPLLGLLYRTVLLSASRSRWAGRAEGDIDTSHFGFLHTGSVQPEDVASDSLLRWTVTNRAPEYHVTDTNYGTMYCAYRAAEAGQTYWRFANFLFPFWTQTP